MPQLSNGKYVLGGRGEKVWENENISANVKYDFDEDRSLKYTFIHTESEYRYQNPWTTIYKDGKPVFSGSVDVGNGQIAVSYTHLRAHETGRNLVCRLLLEKKKFF